MLPLDHSDGHRPYMNENMKLYEVWGGLNVENVGGMKMGKRENPEKTLRVPNLVTAIVPPDNTETRTKDPCLDRRSRTQGQLFQFLVVMYPYHRRYFNLFLKEMLKVFVISRLRLPKNCLGEDVTRFNFVQSEIYLI